MNILLILCDLYKFFLDFEYLKKLFSEKLYDLCLIYEEYCNVEIDREGFNKGCKED